MKRKILNNHTYLSCKIIIVICFFTIVTSCKTKEEITVGNRIERNKIELLDVITANSIQFNTLSCNLKASIKPGLKEKNISSSANLKLIRNQIMQFSFQPFLGFEVFRMVVSTDSLILIDRMNKLYVAESISNIKDATNFDFDFYNLQALFTNQLFLAGKPLVNKEDYKLFTVKQSKDEALISSKDIKNIKYIFSIDHSEKIKSTQITNEEGSTGLSWTYNDFAPSSDNQLFPMEMKMLLNLPKDEFKMDLSFTKVEVEKETKIDFSIPSKYKQITLKQAISIFKNLS